MHVPEQDDFGIVSQSKGLLEEENTVIILVLVLEAYFLPEKAYLSNFFFKKDIGILKGKRSYCISEGDRTGELLSLEPGNQ